MAESSEPSKKLCVSYENGLCVSEKSHPSLAERKKMRLVSELNGISLVANTMFCLACTPEVQEYCTGYIEQDRRHRV